MSAQQQDLDKTANGQTQEPTLSRDAPVCLSERTRRAVQDYTALNTITTATERLYAGTFTAFDVDLLEATRACADGWRVRLACPLGRRMRRVGLLRPDRRRAR